MGKGIVYVMGPTNAGKTTFLSKAQDLYRGVGLIEVGKMFRAKYPPSYFQGRAAPRHTAKEAWSMFLSRLRDLTIDPLVSVIFVDGQPRDVDQVDAVFDMHEGNAAIYEKPIFIYLDCPADIRKHRARIRFMNDPEGLRLAFQRMERDVEDLEEVIHRVEQRGGKITRIPTHNGDEPCFSREWTQTFTAPPSPSSNPPGSESTGPSKPCL